MKWTRKLPYQLKRIGDRLFVILRFLYNGKVNKWRLALLAFSLVYVSFLVANLAAIPIKWDETSHINGGLLLVRGKIQEYAAGGYYPPLYDFVTAGFYQIMGVSVSSGRLAAATFSILSLWIVFEFANQAYGSKIAFFSSLLLGIMPAFFLLSLVAMLETVLVFFFSLSLLIFFNWLGKEKDKTLFLTGLTLGLGCLAKYQALVAGLVMIVCLLLLKRDKLKWSFSKFLFIPTIAFFVSLPWLLVLFQNNGMFDFGLLLNAVSGGSEVRAMYSARFPAPIFYLVELAYPFNDVPFYPISLLVYILGLAGLFLFVWRRKPEDKFLVAWFVTVYVFFTIIPNKEWRYVISLFPVLAISAASFVFFAFTRIAGAVKRRNLSFRRQKLALRIAGLVIIGIAAGSIAYSIFNVFQGFELEQIYIPIDQATGYAAERIEQNESIMVLAPFNFFNRHMVEFYLLRKSMQNRVLQYPELPVDSFMPEFNVANLVWECVEQQVKFVFLYEYGGEAPYFQSNMTAMYVYQELQNSGRFKVEHQVGSFPRTITIFSFV